MKTLDEIVSDAIIVFGGTLNEEDIAFLKEQYVELAKEMK